MVRGFSMLCCPTALVDIGVMSYTVYTEVLDQSPGLGRHIEHDERSKAYAFDTSGLVLASVRHPRHIPVLDQGNLGSCTGNAAVGALGTEPFVGSLDEKMLDEPYAVGIYSDATKADGIRGKYPPTDTGSSGLAVANVCQKRGLVAGYQHTFSLEDALKALTVTPVLAGVGWYSGFDSPDSADIVSISGSIRGGHEFVLDEIQLEARLVGATNSWGTAYGDKGRMYFSFADFERLLGERGDITVLIPNTAPIPTPVPPAPAPTPSPEDVALWADMNVWAKAKGLK